MSDLKKVVLWLEKTNSKNLDQNPDNLKHFLMIDFNYDCEKAMKLIGEVIVANIMKSIIFIGKVSELSAQIQMQMTRLSYLKGYKIILILSRIMLLKTETVAQKLLLLKTVRLPWMTNKLAIY